MDSPERLVYDWYLSGENWHPSNKSSLSVDYQLVKQGDLLKDKDILNLGCFYPEDEQRFANLSKSWMAIDFIPDVISRCPGVFKCPKLTYLVMDMRELKFPDESFDVVLDFSSGDQLDECSYQTVLKEIYRVLRFGGYLAVAFTDRKWFGDAEEYWKTNRYRLGGFAGYTRADTPEEMQLILETAGFRIDHFNLGDQGRSGVLAVK